MIRGAVGPEYLMNRKGFDQSVRLAEERLGEFEEYWEDDEGAQGIKDNKRGHGRGYSQRPRTSQGAGEDSASTCSGY